MGLERNGRPTIVALDVGSGGEALKLVEELQGIAGMFKVGNQLFTAEGPDIVRAIVDRGERVFLDLKFHDIPNTVSRAAVQAAKLGVSMLTVHASGGWAMIEATRRALENQIGDPRPIVVAITVLTSMDEESLERTGVDGTAPEQVLRLAKLAAAAGADGFVCSPEEIRLLRQNLDPNLKIVTPGVRMAGQTVDDQKRVATPHDAIVAGADWVVIGRYVNQAKDPRAALMEVTASLP